MAIRLVCTILQNRVIVADFFFTRCPNICPKMTENMAKLQQSFSHYKQGRKVIDSSIVRFISFSIDPERDSVAALKKYADKFGVNHDNWWMLTGNKKNIYDFALNEVKLGLGRWRRSRYFIYTFSKVCFA